MTNKSPVLSAILTAAVLVMLEQDAHAYLDPGTGSMVFQALAAVVVGGLAAVKVYWHRIKGFFSRNRDQDDDASRPNDLQA